MTDLITNSSELSAHTEATTDPITESELRALRTIDIEYYKTIHNDPYANYNQMIKDIKNVLASKIDIANAGIMSTNHADGYICTLRPDETGRMAISFPEDLTFEDMLCSLYDNICKTRINIHEDYNINVVYKTIGILRIERNNASKETHVHIEEALIHSLATTCDGRNPYLYSFRTMRNIDPFHKRNDTQIITMYEITYMLVGATLALCVYKFMNR